MFLICGLTVSAQPKVQINADTVGVNNVLELTLVHNKSYKNNWENVTVTASFTGPRQIDINGFFYDNTTWKVRFAPPETGMWAYKINFVTPDTAYVLTGSFTCVASQRKGFLRLHPSDPFKLIYPDGSAFNGLGIEDCIVDYNNDGTPLNDWGFDAGFRTATYPGSRTTLNTYFDAYGDSGAGFNLYRWTTDNCSFRLYNNIGTSENTYLINEGKFGDTLVNKLVSSKMRIWLTFFGAPVFGNIDGSTPTEEAAIKRYINYVIARYGAYADIWELFNESSASNYYMKAITSYIRSVDPYKRLISVSDERPQSPYIDINSPHWYEKESELSSDQRAADMINSRKKYGKPIMFGEQGNSVQCWDPLSALRMRLRTWTSFFSEGTLIFWNASWAKDYMHPVAANIYLGPEERGYIRSLHDFASEADSSARPFRISPQNPGEVRAYGLGTKSQVFGYFHHYDSHNSSIVSSFKYRMRKAGTVSWIDPATNAVISSARLEYGSQVITSPAFAVDIAMKIKFDDAETPFNETQKLDLIIYPNPASNSIAVNGNFNNQAAVTLFDVSGTMVYKNNNVLNDQHLALPGLKPGVYIYIIKAGTRQTAGKLLIVN